MTSRVAASRQQYSSEDLTLLEELAIREARKSFWAYRQFMRPTMQIGWFQKQMAVALQQFYEDYKEGNRPILIICTPPQHGKSTSITDLASWIAGQDPDLRKIFGSYSDNLGIRTNLNLQRTYDSARYQRIFPRTKIGSSNVVTISGQKQRNRSILEYLDAEGGFRNTTVEGSITGESLDIGIVDDPIKGAKEARSQVKRDSVWSWMTDDFMSRFSDLGAMLMILTRWHLDDPCGRLLEEFPNATLLRYPALAEEGAELMECDPREEGSGEALFPELKSREFLLSRKQISTKQSFASIYQQTPVVYGAGLFLPDKFQIVEHAPQPEDIEASIRYWDKAGTADGGAYTVGARIDKLRDGRYCVRDVQRGQWSALDRENKIKSTAEVDSANVIIWVEQEPGSGGKESAENTIRELAGYNVHADKVTGSKETRADPYAAQQQGGNILLVRAPWNQIFINEHGEFPNGKYKDQVDAAAGAFAKLIEGIVVSVDDFKFFGNRTEPDF